MEDMESQLGAILGNPQIMQQIMTIAQNFQTEENENPPSADFAPELDFATIQKLTSFIGKTGIDNQQKALLHALGPYLSGNRIQKLEKAMRAAKLAGMASAFLGR